MKAPLSQNFKPQSYKRDQYSQDNQGSKDLYPPAYKVSTSSRGERDNVLSTHQRKFTPTSDYSAGAPHQQYSVGSIGKEYERPKIHLKQVASSQRPVSGYNAQSNLTISSQFHAPFTTTNVTNARTTTQQQFQLGLNHTAREEDFPSYSYNSRARESIDHIKGRNSGSLEERDTYQRYSMGHQSTQIHVSKRTQPNLNNFLLSSTDEKPSRYQPLMLDHSPQMSTSKFSYNAEVFQQANAGGGRQSSIDNRVPMSSVSQGTSTRFNFQSMRDTSPVSQTKEQPPQSSDMESIIMNLNNKIKNLEGKYIDLANFYKKELVIQKSSTVQPFDNNSSPYITRQSDEYSSYHQRYHNRNDGSRSKSPYIPESIDHALEKNIINELLQEKTDLERELSSIINMQTKFQSEEMKLQQKVNNLELINHELKNQTLKQSTSLSSKEFDQLLRESHDLIDQFSLDFIDFINSNYKSFTEKDISGHFNILKEKIKNSIETIAKNSTNNNNSQRVSSRNIGIENRNINSQSSFDEENSKKLGIEFKHSFDEFELNNEYTIQNIKKAVFELQNKNDTSKIDLKKIGLSLQALAQASQELQQQNSKFDFNSIGSDKQIHSMKSAGGRTPSAQINHDFTQGKVAKDILHHIQILSSSFKNINSKINLADDDLKVLSEIEKESKLNIASLKECYEKMINQFDQFKPSKQNKSNQDIQPQNNKQLQDLKIQNEKLLKDLQQMSNENLQLKQKQEKQVSPFRNFDEQLQNQLPNQYFQNEVNILQQKLSLLEGENANITKQLRSTNKKLEEKTQIVWNLEEQLNSIMRSNDITQLQTNQPDQNKDDEKARHLLKYVSQFLYAMKKLQKAVHKKEANPQKEKSEFETTRKDLESVIKQLKKKFEQIDKEKANMGSNNSQVPSDDYTPNQIGRNLNKYQGKVPQTLSARNQDQMSSSKKSTLGQQTYSNFTIHQSAGESSIDRSAGKSPIPLRQKHGHQQRNIIDNFRSIEPFDRKPLTFTNEKVQNRSPSANPYENTGYEQHDSNHQFANMKREIDLLRQEIRDLHFEGDHLKQNLMKLDSEKDQVSVDRDNVAHELLGERRKLESTIRELNNLQLEKESLLQEYQKATRGRIDYEQLELDLQTEQQTTEKLYEQLEMAEKVNLEQKKMIEYLEEHNQDFENFNEQLEQKDNQIQHLNDKIEQLQTNDTHDINNNTYQQVDSQEILNQVQEKINSITQEQELKFSDLNKQIESKDQKLNKLSRQLDRKLKEIELLKQNTQTSINEESQNKTQQEIILYKAKIEELEQTILDQAEEITLVQDSKQKLNVEILEKKKIIQQMKVEKEQQISQFQNELQQQQDTYTQQQDEATLLIDKLHKQNSSSDDKIKQCEVQLKNLKSTYDSQLKQLKIDNEKRVNDLRIELDQEKQQDIENELSSLREEHSINVRSIKDKHEKQLKQLELKLNQQKGLQSEVQMTKDQYEQKILQLQQEHQNAINEVEQQNKQMYTSQLDQEKNKLLKKYSELEHKYMKEKENLTNEFNNKFNEIQSQNQSQEQECEQLKKQIFEKQNSIKDFQHQIQQFEKALSNNKLITDREKENFDRALEEKESDIEELKIVHLNEIKSLQKQNSDQIQQQEQLKLDKENALQQLKQQQAKQNDQHQRSIKEKDEQIENLKQEIHQLEDIIKRTQNDGSNYTNGLKQQIEILKQQVKQKDSQISEQSSQIDSLQENQITLEQSVQEKENTLQDLTQNKIPQLQNERNGFEQQLKQKSLTCNEQQRRIQKQESDINEFTQQQEEAQDEQDRLEIQVDEQNQQINKLEEEKNYISSQLSQLNNKYNEEKEKVKSQQQSLKTLEMQLQDQIQLTSEQDQIDQVIKQKQDELVKLQSKFNEVDELSKKQTIKIDQKQKEYDEMFQQKEKLNQSFQKYQIDFTELLNQVAEKDEEIQRRITNSQTKEDQFKKEKQNLLDQIQLLTQELNDLKQGKQQSESDKDNSINDLKKQIQNYLQQISDLETEQKFTQQQKQEIDLKCIKANKDLIHNQEQSQITQNQLQNTIENDKETINNLNQQIQQLQLQIQQIQDDIQQKDIDIQQDKDNIERIQLHNQTQSDDFKQKIQSLKHDIEVLKKDHTEQLHTKDVNIQQAIEEKVTAQNQIKDLINQNHFDKQSVEEKLQNQLQDALSKIMSKDEEIQQQRQIVDDKQSIIQEGLQREEQLLDKMNQLEDLAEQYQEEMQQLENTREKHQQTLENNRNLIQMLKTELQKSIDKQKQLEQNHEDDQEAKGGEVNEQVQMLQQQIQKLRNESEDKLIDNQLKIDELESENKIKNELIEEATRLVEEYNDEKHILKAKFKHLLQILEDVEEESSYKEDDEVDLEECFDKFEKEFLRNREQAEARISQIQRESNLLREQAQGQSEELQNVQVRMAEVQIELMNALNKLETNDITMRKQMETASRKIQNYKEKLIEKQKFINQVEQEKKNSQVISQQPSQNNSVIQENVQLLQKLQKAENELQNYRLAEQNRRPTNNNNILSQQSEDSMMNQSLNMGMQRINQLEEQMLHLRKQIFSAKDQVISTLSDTFAKRLKELQSSYQNENILKVKLNEMKTEQQIQNLNNNIKLIKQIEIGSKKFLLIQAISNSEFYFVDEIKLSEVALQYLKSYMPTDELDQTYLQFDEKQQGILDKLQENLKEMKKERLDMVQDLSLYKAKITSGTAFEDIKDLQAIELEDEVSYLNVENQELRLKIRDFVVQEALQKGRIVELNELIKDLTKNVDQESLQKKLIKLVEENRILKDQIQESRKSLGRASKGGRKTINDEEDYDDHSFLEGIQVADNAIHTSQREEGEDGEDVNNMFNESSLANVIQELNEGEKNKRDSLNKIDQLRTKIGKLELQIDDLQEKNRKLQAEVQKSQSLNKDDQSVIHHIKGTLIQFLKNCPITDRNNEQVLSIVLSSMEFTKEEISEIQEFRKKGTTGGAQQRGSSVSGANSGANSDSREEVKKKGIFGGIFNKKDKGSSQTRGPASGTGNTNESVRSGGGDMGNIVSPMRPIKR